MELQGAGIYGNNKRGCISEVTGIRNKLSTSGMTLVEIMVGTFVSALVIAGVLAVFSYVALTTRAGVSQIQFTQDGRNASYKITRYIEEGRAASAGSNGISIVMLDLTVARIYFSDGDGDPETVEDNKLEYDPDVLASGGEVTVCSYITPIAGEQMFGMVSADSSAVRMSFHVGDGTNVMDTSFSRTGIGYQGLEVRLSATPRNVQRWYD